MNNAKRNFIALGAIFMMVMLGVALVCILMVATSTPAHSQAGYTTAILTTDKVWIADETYKKENAKSISIITSNAKVVSIIQTKYHTFTSMTVSKKKDRKGDYWQYTFRYKREDYNNIKL